MIKAFAYFQYNPHRNADNKDSLVIYDHRSSPSIFTVHSLAMHLPRVAVCVDALVSCGVWRHHDGAVFAPGAASAI